MKKCYLFLIIVTITFCLDAQWEYVHLPKPTGKYLVGTHSIYLHDASPEVCRRVGEGGCELMIQAYFPIRNSETCPTRDIWENYMPGTLVNGLVTQRVVVRSYAKFAATCNVKGSFPVIIVQPAAGALRQSYSILCEELASQGFIVLSMDIPNVSGFIQFNDGRCVSSSWIKNKLQGDDGVRRIASEAIGCVLAALPLWNEEYFNRHLNTSRVGLLRFGVWDEIALLYGPRNLKNTAPYISCVIDVCECNYFGDTGISDLVRTYKGLSVYYLLGCGVDSTAFQDMTYIAEKIKKMPRASLTEIFLRRVVMDVPIFDFSLSGIHKRYSAFEWFKALRRKITSWLGEELVR